MRRYIPNTITLLNLVCGSCAIYVTLTGHHYYPAFLFIITAACFDFLDGFSARLLKAYSDIGKELDSLSDMVSFGLAPSLMWLEWYQDCNHTLTAPGYLALMIAAFSALRLAKFNIDTHQKLSFIGLPTPACAMIVAGMTGYAQICEGWEIPSRIVVLLNNSWFIPSSSVILSILLTSGIPMFSMKGKLFPLKANPARAVFFVLTPVTLAIVSATRYGLGFFKGILPLTLSLSFTLYIVLNIIFIPFNQRVPYGEGH